MLYIFKLANIRKIAKKSQLKEKNTCKAFRLFKNLKIFVY